MGRPNSAAPRLLSIQGGDREGRSEALSKPAQWPIRAMSMTPPMRLWLPLLSHLNGNERFAEPCCGNGALMRHLERYARLRCVYAGDIATGQDAGRWRAGMSNSSSLVLVASCIASAHLASEAPAAAWLLLDADWIAGRAAGHMHSVPRSSRWAECAGSPARPTPAWTQLPGTGSRPANGDPLFWPRRSSDLAVLSTAARPSDDCRACPRSWSLKRRCRPQ